MIGKSKLPVLSNNQDKGELKKSFKDLFGSIKYMFQSASGKRSLETYLETISEFTDETIIEAEKEGLNYVGGQCSMKLNPLNEAQILASIELQFQSVDGTWKKKQAQRVLEKSIFTTEAIKQIGSGEGLAFHVESPIRR